MMTAPLVDDCFRQDPRDKSRLTHVSVLEQLRARIVPVVEANSVPLSIARGRIAAQDVIAQRAVPGHTNAAVDGYAFALANLNSGADTLLRVVDRAAAGSPASRIPKSDEAIRIFTGAVLPEGCDTVVMQEDCTVAGDNGERPNDTVDTSADAGDTHVSIPSGLKQGANVRLAGEDLAIGSAILNSGDTLRPQDLAALASVGEGSVQCYAPPKIAIVSTGDEVVRAGSAELSVGQVYDANAPMLFALATAAGCSVDDLGVLPDRQDKVVSSLAAAAQQYDVILTTGGASQGDEDHMARAIDELGTRHFWQIAVKPGRPLMFGQLGNSIVVGLPGNPVAVFVCFLMYVHPILKRLGGAHWPEPRRYSLPAAFTFNNRKVGRREFWRGTTRMEEGTMVVDKFARDGSGLISSLREADGLIEVPEHVPQISIGQPVNFIPFSEFGIAL